MRTLLLLAVAAWLGGAVKDDIPVDPGTLKAGEWACVFPIHVTVELGVWVGPRKGTFYRNLVDGCIFDALRAKGGWYIDTHGVHLIVTKTQNKELRRLGFLQLGQVDVLSSSVTWQ